MNFRLTAILLLVSYFIGSGCFRGNHPKTEEFLEGSLAAEEVTEVVIRQISAESLGLRKFDDYKTDTYSTKEFSQIRVFLDQLHAGMQARSSGTSPESVNSGEWNFVAKISFASHRNLYLYRVYSEKKGTMLRISTNFDYIDGSFHSEFPILEFIRSEWTGE